MPPGCQRRPPSGCCLRRYGSGAIGLLVLYQAGVLIVPLEALVSSADR
jgi:hypothetical protein